MQSLRGVPILTARFSAPNQYEKSSDVSSGYGLTIARFSVFSMDLLESVELSRGLFISLGVPGMFAVAILEFFLLPIPPDLVLIPLALAQPELAPVYAITATAGSVLAGFLGYLAGRKGGRPVLESRFSSQRANAQRPTSSVPGSPRSQSARSHLSPRGTSCSQSRRVFSDSPRTYLLASLVGRGGRYFLEAALVLVLGDAVRSLGEVDLYVILGVAAIIVVAAYLLRRWWMPERWRTAAD